MLTSSRIDGLGLQDVTHRRQWPVNVLSTREWWKTSDSVVPGRELGMGRKLGQSGWPTSPIFVVAEVHRNLEIAPPRVESDNPGYSDYE